MTVAISRYLGPVQFGSLSYALALVALITPVASLGLDNIVLIDLTDSSSDKHHVLGTTCCLKLIAGTIAAILCIAMVSLLKPDSEITRLIAGILAIGIVIRTAETVSLWFTYKVQAKYIIFAKTGAMILVSLIQLSMILRGASVLALVWMMLCEIVLSAVSLIILYQIYSGSDIRQWRLDTSRAKSLLKRGWPLVFSSLAITIYMKADQLMLGQMVGDEALGIYAVAARISEAIYFVPIAIVSSLTPKLIEIKREAELLYYQKFQQLFSLMALLGISVSIVTSLIATPLVIQLFSPAYAQAGAVLALHTWSFVFVCFGVAQGVWAVTENLQLMILGRVVCGGLLNIVLNLLLIPDYGAMGATIATLISYIAINYFSNAIQSPTKRIFEMQSKAFLLSQLIPSRSN